MDRAILEHDALQLPAHERALLTDALIDSFDDEIAKRNEASWASEADTRLAAFRRGEASALDGPVLLNALRGQFRGE